jgi:hypothetical protein
MVSTDDVPVQELMEQTELYLGFVVFENVTLQ